MKRIFIIYGIVLVCLAVILIVALELSGHYRQITMPIAVVATFSIIFVIISIIPVIILNKVIKVIQNNKNIIITINPIVLSSILLSILMYFVIWAISFYFLDDIHSERIAVMGGRTGYVELINAYSTNGYMIDLKYIVHTNICNFSNYSSYKYNELKKLNLPIIWSKYRYKKYIWMLYIPKYLNYDRIIILSSGKILFLDEEQYEEYKL